MTRQTYTFKAVGDCEIRADVYSPASGGARPGIVWIHGGALVSGSREVIHSGQLENYLETGYVFIDGGGHGFDGRMDSPVVCRAFERVLAFLKQHLA